MPSVSIPNFVGGSYRQTQLSVDAEECINMYPENQEVPGAKAPVVLQGAPGFNLYANFPPGPIRSTYDVNGSMYVVSGNLVYRKDPSGLVTLYTGTIANDGLPVPMAFGNSGRPLLVSGGIAYTLSTSFSGPAVTAVSNPPWINAVDCAFSNGYFVILDDNGTSFSGGQFFISALNDSTTWNALDFTTVPVGPYQVKALGVTHNEIWVFTTSYTQPFYYNPSSTDFPWIANQQVLVEQGITNRDSRANLDNTLFWVGRSQYGQLQAFTANGYLAQRISTYPIEQEWSTYTNPLDCTTWVFQMNGHLFWNLNFNTDDKSWRYDHATNLWHRIAYRNPASGLDECHRGNTHCLHLGQHLIGDRKSQAIFQLSSQIYSDNSDALIATRRAPFPFMGNKRVFFPVFELITTPGIGNPIGKPGDMNPVWMLRWSNNNGKTWSPQFDLPLGELGQYYNRQRKVNCGSGRNRVWEVSISANVPRCIIGAELPEGIIVQK